MKSKYSDTYLHSTMQLIIKITQSGFRLLILAVDTWSIHVWQTEATRARCYLRREREGVKTQHNWHNSLACQRSPVYSAALSAVLTFLLAAFQPTTPVFPSTLALNMEDASHCLVRHQGPQQSLSPCLLPSHPSQPSDWSCQGSLRPRSCSQASFLPILQQTQAHKSRGRSQSCLRVRLCQVWRNRGLQAKLRELTGGVYDFEESDESDSDDQLSDC